MKIFCFIPMHLMTFSIECQAKLDLKHIFSFSLLMVFSLTLNGIGVCPAQFPKHQQSIGPTITKNVFVNNILICWLAFIEQLFQYYGI